MGIDKMDTNRKLAILKCIELAVTEIITNNPSDPINTELDVINLTTQYGKSINIQKEEVLYIFELKVREIMLSKFNQPSSYTKVNSRLISMTDQQVKSTWDSLNCYHYNPNTILEGDITMQHWTEMVYSELCKRNIPTK